MEQVVYQDSKEVLKVMIKEQVVYQDSKEVLKVVI